MACLDAYDVGVILGTGSFGRVRFAQHKVKEQQKYCAVKVLRKIKLIQYQQVDHIQSEKRILSMLSEKPHPFIVQLYETFHDDKRLYLVLEYVIGGEFFTHLRNARQFSDGTSQFFAAIVVLIFEFLHSKNIIYRDLKPENLLLDKHGYIKITDFGFAKIVDSMTFTLCGTPEYIAPEVILNRGHGKGFDWWTLGVLIYEMITGGPPFEGVDQLDLYDKIIVGKIRYPSYYPRDVKILTKKLLMADLTKRFGCLAAGTADIKKCNWFKNLNWDALLKKKLKPPIIPDIRSEDDTSNFDYFSEEESEDEEILDDDLSTDPFHNF